jgi:hypothetical protein
LVTWAGANSTWGPVSQYLGLLAIQLGRLDTAVDHFRAAIALEEQIGALPFLAESLTGLADAVSCRGGPGDLPTAAESRRRARWIGERLGMTGLLGRLSPPADEWTLTRDGDDWLLQAGNERARLRDGRGLQYLRALVAAPGHDIPSLDLVAGGAGLAESGTGPLLDAAAHRSYQHRLADLEAELDAADRAGDPARAERADAERRVLIGELRRATGVGGRQRQTSPEAERARVNVTLTIRAAVERIARTAPKAASHLRASIRTGRACRYEPVPGGPVRWHV